MNKVDLQQLADIRIAEAASLLGLTTPMPDGAYYLAGYAVECALKARIAGMYGQHDWPEKKFVSECHTHNILTLVRLAGLEVDLAADSKSNIDLALNWSIVKDWNERDRYERHSGAKTQKLITSITDDPNGGIAMDHGPLVSEQIDAGAKLASEFASDHQPLQAAFWLKESDDGQWFLYLVSDQIDDSNFDLAYREVLKLLGPGPHMWLDPLQVKVAGSDDPLAQAVEDVQRTQSTRLATRLRNRMLGGLSIEEVYIYRHPITTPN